MGIPFATGTLWETIQQRTQSALQCNTLLPITTQQAILPDQGVDFLVRQVSSLTQKHKLKMQLESAADSAENPFLPYDPELFVSDVTDKHICLLNKFNVIENHVLVVTREFEHQECLLSEADFAAWFYCMTEFPALGFYNGGVGAGASQSHKHMQLIPLPMGSGEYECPMIPLLQNAKSKQSQGSEVLFSVALPFKHAIIELQADEMRHETTAAAYLLACYNALLAAAGIQAVGGRQSAPYNLLITRQWMWLVPRTQECFETISINALGFAGSLFVRNAAQFDLLRRVGPMHVLQSVSESQANC